MNFIGIDPSTSSTGYAVVDENENIVTVGKIEGLADDPSSFNRLYKELNNIFNHNKPTAICCETQFIGANRNTSIKLIRPTGVVLAVSGAYDVPFDFLAPSTWRNMYQGSGKWSKKDSYSFTFDKYPDIEKKLHKYGILKNGKFSEKRQYKECNDMTDAIGIACACKRIYEEKNHG